MLNSRFFVFFLSFSLVYLPLKKVNACKVETIEIANIKNTVISFLDWHYQVRYKLKEYKIVAGIPEDSNHPYHIDYSEFEKYVSFLETSNFLSKFFINSLRFYIKRCDSLMLSKKQYYWIPFGFSQDLITKDSDDKEIENNFKKLKIIKSKKLSKVTKCIIVDFGTGRKYEFQVRLHKKKWYIDKINEDFADRIISTELPPF